MVMSAIWTYLFGGFLLAILMLLIAIIQTRTGQSMVAEKLTFWNIVAIVFAYPIIYGALFWLALKKNDTD